MLQACVPRVSEGCCNCFVQMLQSRSRCFNVVDLDSLHRNENSLCWKFKFCMLRMLFSNVVNVGFECCRVLHVARNMT
jgi:hypothetical protein